MQSEIINELATALSKAQSAIGGAKKDSENPFFKSKYADLASVWDACRDPLTKNGLSVIQTTESENGHVYVVTTLAHSSGQWISGKLQIFPKSMDSQAIGSAITYARRYALSAMVGTYQEDDDAEAAMHRGTATIATAQHSQPAKVMVSPVHQAGVPYCKTCGEALRKSAKKPVYYCPNFKDESKGKHPNVPESEIENYIASQSASISSGLDMTLEDIQF